MKAYCYVQVNQTSDILAFFVVALPIYLLSINKAAIDFMKFMVETISKTSKHILKLLRKPTKFIGMHKSYVLNVIGSQ